MYINKQGNEINFLLQVKTRPNLRDGNHEMRLYVGRSILENIFDKKVVDEKTKEIYLYYPETWCNIPELQKLMDFIVYFYPNIEKLVIETHSVYIIQNVHAKNIKIYDDPAEYPQSNDPMKHLAPSDSYTGQLQVFKGIV